MEDPGMTARGIAGSRGRGVFVEDRGRVAREDVISSKGFGSWKAKSGRSRGMLGYRVQGRARNRPREGDSAGWRDLEWLRVCGSPRMGGTRDGGMYRKGCSRGSERTSGTRDIGLSSKGRARGSERTSGTRDIGISSKGCARNRPRAGDSAGRRDLEYRACTLLDCPRRAVHQGGISSR